MQDRALTSFALYDPCGTSGLWTIVVVRN